MTAFILLYVPGTGFIPGETLILLDEIQDCPQTRSSLKYRALDGRYDVIAAASLPGVHLKGYEDDIAKYAESESVKVRAQACWKSVPRQLLKENHKFQYKLVKHGATSTYFMGSFDWLEKAVLLRRCCHVKEPVFPLNGYCDESNYRVYMNDIGLPTASYGFQTKAAVIQNDLPGSLKGALYENMLADMLIKKDIPLYYYRNEKGT